MATGQQILALPMQDNDASASTVGGYLTALLRQLWSEQEGFSGKRPFGNSGWLWDVYVPLIKAGFIRGEIDEDGYIEDCDAPGGHRLIHLAIDALWTGAS